MPSLPAVLASAGASEEQAQILLALAFVLAGAKLAGALVARVGQPAVLGELLVGILLGNLVLLGGPSLAALSASETFAVIAELGAILLLFDVGLESTPKEMLAVSLW
jgi:Kef-type K+ transport system membrane component KefB